MPVGRFKKKKRPHPDEEKETQITSPPQENTTEPVIHQPRKKRRTLVSAIDPQIPLLIVRPDTQPDLAEELVLAYLVFFSFCDRQKMLCLPTLFLLASICPSYQGLPLGFYPLSCMMMAP